MHAAIEHAFTFHVCMTITNTWWISETNDCINKSTADLREINVQIYTCINICMKSHKRSWSIKHLCTPGTRHTQMLQWVQWNHSHVYLQDWSQENRCLLVCFHICVSMRVLYVLNASILYFAKENIISCNSGELVQHSAGCSNTRLPSLKPKWNLLKKWSLNKIIPGA